MFDTRRRSSWRVSLALLIKSARLPHGDRRHKFGYRAAREHLKGSVVIRVVGGSHFQHHKYDYSACKLSPTQFSLCQKKKRLYPMSLVSHPSVA